MDDASLRCDAIYEPTPLFRHLSSGDKIFIGAPLQTSCGQSNWAGAAFNAFLTVWFFYDIYSIQLDAYSIFDFLIF